MIATVVVQAARLVVYDFHSPERSSLGVQVRRVFTGHAQRSGAFSTWPEVEQEEILEEHPFEASFSTAAEKVAEHARSHFGADLAIWGSVRVEGAQFYLDVAAAAAVDSFSEGSATVHRHSYRCPNVHYIPRAADVVLAECLGLKKGEEELAVRRLLSENLVPNGSFDDGMKGWEASARGASVVEMEGRRCLELELSRKLAVSQGLSCKSAYVELKPGAHYVFSLDAMTEKPSVIVWLRGYSMVGGERREVYRHQLRFRPKARGLWEKLRSRPFRPGHPTHPPRWMRMMLYSYKSPGRAYFDEVVLRKVEVAVEEGK